MKLYRYSPITDEYELGRAIGYLHLVSHQLCYAAYGKYLPVAGNVGIFCHYPQEYNELSKVRDALVNKSEHYNNKYYKLKEPITIPATADIPAATYDYLYVRQPDPYRAQVGDIDFVLEPSKHEAFKKKLNTETFEHYARLFHRPEENMIELSDPDKDVLSYIVTNTMRDHIAALKR